MKENKETERRKAFDIKIVDNCKFLSMSPNAQGLYFNLGMKADKNGFINLSSLDLSVYKCSAMDLNILISRGFAVLSGNKLEIVKDFEHWEQMTSNKTPLL